MPITNVLAVVTVADFDATRIWYERLLGRPADRLPMPGCAEWQITANGGLQLVRNASRAGKAFVTLGVVDLEGHLAYLAGRGLAAGVITEGRTEGGQPLRIASITDPEGNRITFAEEPSSRPLSGRV
jgi:catechol 2,3-dioxygenase-like lactoylglutathione lyase family enzyme